MDQRYIELATAAKVKQAVAIALINKTLVHSKIGDGSLSIREIICAVMLATAHEYWVLNATKLMNDTHRKRIESALSSANKHYDLNTLPMLLTRNSAANEKTDESEVMECFSGVYTRVEEGASFLRFLDTLNLYPAEQYWRSIYSRLDLDYPEFDPDRLTSDDQEYIYKRWIAFIGKLDVNPKEAPQALVQVSREKQNKRFLIMAIFYILALIYLLYTLSTISPKALR